MLIYVRQDSLCKEREYYPGFSLGTTASRMLHATRTKGDKVASKKRKKEIQAAMDV
jgi:hypothetical protein